VRGLSGGRGSGLVEGPRHQGLGQARQRHPHARALSAASATADPPPDRHRSNASLAQEGGRITGEGCLKVPFSQVDGYLSLPTAPGLGVELDEDALADKVDHDWQNPKSYAEDGSAIDW